MSVSPLLSPVLPGLSDGNAYASTGLTPALLGELEGLTPTSVAPQAQPSSVSLSGLAQLQLASSDFESALQQLQPATPATTGSAGGPFGGASSSQTLAQGLVSAFNTLSARLGALQADPGPAAQVATQYADTLAQAAQSVLTTPQGASGTLGQIGLDYQPGSDGGPGTLVLNGAAFTSALASDPQRAAGLLNQALLTLTRIPPSFGGDGGVIPSTLAAYQQAVYLAQALQPVAAPVPTPAELAADQGLPAALNPAQIAQQPQLASVQLPLQRDFSDAQLVASLYGGSDAGNSLSVLA